MRCEAITKSGGQCRNSAVDGELFCWMHIDENSPYEDEDWDIDQSHDEGGKTARDIFQEEMDKDRKIPLAKLQEIIESHEEWKQSDGQSGKQANLSGAQFSLINFGRLWMPDAIMNGVIFMASGLKDSFFSGSELRNANLNDTDLRDSSLSGTDLRGAYLANARLSGASFVDANLQGANLRGAFLNSEEKSEVEIEQEIEDARAWLGVDEDLDEDAGPDTTRHAADVSGADFRHADLSGAQLDEVTGLEPNSLSGTNLTAAKLSDDLAKFELLEYIAELSKVAKATWLTLMAASLYCWLMIVNTTDITGTTGEATIPLPIINTDIPVRGFFIVGPALLCVIFVYFQSYLQRLWTALASLPARFPDGRALDERVHPWLFTSLIRLYVPLLKTQRPRLWWLQFCMTLFSGWVVVPGTVVGFVARYWASDDPLGIVVLVATATVAIFVSVYTWYVAKVTFEAEINMEVQEKG